MRRDDMMPRDPSDININTSPPVALDVEEFFLKQKLKNRKSEENAFEGDDEEPEG
jgi:hypothetical protein